MRLTTWLNALKNRKTRCQRLRRRSVSYRMATLSTESLEERQLLSVNPLTDAAAESGDSSPVRILVQMRDTASAQQTIQSMNAWAAHVQSFKTPGLMSVELPDGVEMQAALDAWAANPEVQFAEPDYVITAGQFTTSTVNDPGFDNLYGLHNTGQTGGRVDADIDAPEAWSITTGDGSVVVAVIDSGVDYTHEDLAANIWTNPGEIPGNGIDDDGNGFVDDSV